MDWGLIAAGFADELEKISEISLSGLSPQRALSIPQAAQKNTIAGAPAGTPPGPPERPQPPPALRGEGVKLATGDSAVDAHMLYTSRGGPLRQKQPKDKADRDAWEKSLRVGARALTGGSAGNILSRLSLKDKSIGARRQTIGMLTGAAIALTEPKLHSRFKKYRARKAEERKAKAPGVKQASASPFQSPGERLRSSRQVGTLRSAASGSAPSLRGMLIGKKFTLPRL
jgi:hypothetical protein